MLLTVCVLAVGVLGLHAGNECYVRFSTEQVEETLTVVTADSRLVMVPIVHSTGKTTWVQMVPTWYTDITCEEYPQQEFTASGKHDWAPGARVSITFYVRDGEKIRCDL